MTLQPRHRRRKHASLPHSPITPDAIRLRSHSPISHSDIHTHTLLHVAPHAEPTQLPRTPERGTVQFEKLHGGVPSLVCMRRRPHSHSRLGRL